jgi:sugar transferase (PEP-CTERM/EpsH1 system associated)
MALEERENGEILFLAHRMPFPPDRGDKIRSFNMLKAISHIAPVHVGCFADDGRDRGFAKEMAELTASQCVVSRDRSKPVAGMIALATGRPVLVALYQSAKLRRWVEHILATRPIHAVVACSVQMADFIPRDLPVGRRFIMDFVDFDSAKYAAYAEADGGVMGWINRREGRVLFDFERDVARRADVSLFVSEAETELFARAADVAGRDICTLGNGVDLKHFNQKAVILKVENEHNPLVVFTGQMDYRPNIEAVKSFAREAMPLIRAVHPRAGFAIVGRNPTREVEALGSLPGVSVTGAVPDIRGWLAAADVVVAPLRIARGVQNKVLEAMAMARPVVASPQAAEGIDAADGMHLIVAAGPEAEAQSVLDLLADPARARALGAAARSRVEARYDWQAMLSPLRQILFPQAPDR